MNTPTDPRVWHWRQIIQMISGIWIGSGLWSIGDSLYEAYIEYPLQIYLPPFDDDPWGYINALRHDIWERTRFRWIFTVVGGLTFLIAGLAIERILPELMDRNQK